MNESDLDELVSSASDHLAWISNEDIPEPIPVFEEYYENYFDEESGLTPDRLKAIANGTKATEQENKLLLDSFLWKAYEGAVHYCEVHSMAFVQRLSRDNKNEWLIISTTGTSFEGTYSELYGSFASKEDAIKSLCEDGYLEGHNDIF
jgi:hypothetical protein